MGVRLDRFEKGGSAHSAGFRHAGDAEGKGRRRILIVDDNRDAALTLAMLLRAMGYSTVAVAHDGRAALAIASEQHLDVALIDLVMPDIDGFELAHRLRGTQGNTTMRLIALTGFADDLFVRYAKDARFDELLAKPASVRDLESALET